jgi:peptidoglycan glycosyltransferase
MTRSSIASRRRNQELVLMVMAAVLTMGAYVLASLGKTSSIPANLYGFLFFVVILLLAAHLATRWLAAGADSVLLPMAALLNGIGYVMIVRVDTRNRLAGLQSVWTLFGIALYILTLVVVRRVPDLARYKWTVLLLGAGLLVMPMVPGIGTFNGTNARLWVRVGPISFQPGEFAKILLAVFFAAYLAERRELIASGSWRVGPLRLPEPKHFFPILLAWGFTVLVLVGQKDLGSGLLFFTLFVVMLWVATERATFLAVGGVLFAGAAVLAWKTFSNVQDRVQLWLDPWARYGGPTRALDKGRQAVQAWFAFANGGLVGTGLGQGSPNKIPAVYNDYIFAAIGEELGLIGATAILISFLLMIGAGLSIAVKAQRPFEKLLATGLTTIMGVQAFVIMGGVTRLLPLTGVTLPFMSYGGSSLVANFALLGLLMRISDSSARLNRELPDEPTLSERLAARRLQRRLARQARRERHLIPDLPPFPGVQAE